MTRTRSAPLLGRFTVRLAVSLVITTTGIGLAQYELAGRALTSRVLAHDLEGHRADAQVLASLHRPGTADPLSEVAGLLGHMSSRPGLASVLLAGPDGDVVLEGRRHEPATAAHAATDAHAGTDTHAGTDAHAGTPTGDSPHGAVMTLDPVRRELVDEALRDGTAHAERRRDAGQVLHAVPVELAGVRHVLLVVRGDGPLEAQVGSVRRVLVRTLALGAALAVPLFFLVGGRDLSARHRRAVDASTRDGLTGLGNHRRFHERLGSAVTDPSGALTLSLVDLDHFEQVNDGAGHRRGDEVLAAVAAVLLDLAPTGAHRVGGDEFALLLALPLAEAAAVAEQVRARVAALDVGVSTSIGVASLTPGSTAQALWDAADAALYAAKHGGRDRVVVDAGLAALERV